MAVAPLQTFGARTAVDLAPAGWSGREAPATGDILLELIDAAMTDDSLALRLERADGAGRGVGASGPSTQCGWTGGAPTP